MSFHLDSPLTTALNGQTENGFQPSSYELSTHEELRVAPSTTTSPFLFPVSPMQCAINCPQVMASMNLVDVREMYQQSRRPSRQMSRNSSRPSSPRSSSGSNHFGLGGLRGRVTRIQVKPTIDEETEATSQSNSLCRPPHHLYSPYEYESQADFQAAMQDIDPQYVAAKEMTPDEVLFEHPFTDDVDQAKLACQKNQSEVELPQLHRRVSTQSFSSEYLYGDTQETPETSVAKRPQWKKAACYLGIGAAVLGGAAIVAAIGSFPALPVLAVVLVVYIIAAAAHHRYTAASSSDQPKLKTNHTHTETSVTLGKGEKES